MKLSTIFILLMLSTTMVFGQLEAKIDSIFSEYNNSPGCAVGVYSNGEILFKKGYGIANLDYDIKISPETVFDIGSVSKQFTAACILILENRGKLSLDDDIRKYIPEISEFKEGTITIRNLLHHTSGLRDYLTLMFLSGRSFDDSFTEQMGLDILTNQKELNFTPGTEYMYSNSGYLALAIIIRRVSDESIGDFAKKNIFDPLQMGNTFIYEDGTKVVKNRAIGYSEQGYEYKREHHFDFLGGGDGQVYTTVEDFFKWNENFKSIKVGNSSFLDKMLTKGRLSTGDTIEYALGLTHGVYKNLKTIGHGGSWGGFRAHYVQFPDKDLAIAVMSNFSSVNTESKAMQIADLILDYKLDEITENTQNNTSLKDTKIKPQEYINTQLIGKYEIQTGADLEISIKNDSLHVFQTWNSNSYNIINTTGNTYEIFNDNSLQFVFSELKDNVTQQLTVIQNGDKTVCKRKEKINISTVNLQDYTGNFYSEELGVDYLISTEPGLEIAQIVIQAKATDKEESETIEQLKTIRNDVLKNASSFSSKAILYSQDPESSSRGGSYTLDKNQPKMVQEFRKQAFQLKEGEISQPFKTNYGWHIVTVDKIRGALIDVRHILLVPIVSSATLDEAQNTLNLLSKRITDGEISFSDAAREFSDDQITSTNGGSLINPETGNTHFSLASFDVQVYKQIATLKDNEISEPILEEDPTGRKKYKIVTVSNRKNKLNVKIPNSDTKELQIYKTDVFNSSNAILRFIRHNGVVKGFEFDFGRVKNLTFEKK